MAKKSTSKLQQSHYSTYKADQRWKSNREAKLKKLIKQHPNNLQLVEALKNIKYRRKTPKASTWSKATKTMASLIKYFCRKCPLELFNSNNDVKRTGLRNMIDSSPYKGSNIDHDRTNFFAIGNRVSYKT